MDEHRIVKSTNRWLLFIILILILVIIGLTRYLVYQNTLFNKAFIYETNAMYKQNEYNSSTNKLVPRVKSFSIKLTAEEGKEKDYTIDNNYNIHSKILKVSDSRVEYSFCINNSDYIYNDWALYDDQFNSITLRFCKLGQYLSFESTGTTGIQNLYLSIFNNTGSLYKTIHSYDDNDNIEDYDIEKTIGDMAIANINYEENAILITVTRSSDSGIIYNEKAYEVNKSQDYPELPEDLPITKQYKYKIDSEGNINFNKPEVKIIKTYKDYLNES